MRRSLLKTIVPAIHGGCSKRSFVVSPLVVFALIAVWLFTASEVFAQGWPAVDLETKDDLGSGFYFAWWKFVLIVPPFWFWVKVADWISRDTEMVEKKTEMWANVWNPLVVGLFLFGLLAILFVPFFLLSYPLYLVCATVPFFIYTVKRNKHFEGADVVFSKKFFAKRRAIKNLKDGEDYVEEAEVLAQDTGAEVEFSAAGPDKMTKQRNMIVARQNYMFLSVKELIADALWKRADNVRLDYTREAVAIHYQIDGLWQPMPQLDRESGDAMLAVIKSIANLKVEDRRSKQESQFDFKVPDRSMRMKVKSQGTATGEVVLLTVIDKKAASMSLEQLGMRDDTLERLNKYLHQPGYPLISAMPGDGLSSTWNAVLEEIDRVTRELVGLIKSDNDERTVENITFHDVGDGKDVMETVGNLLLKEPDGFIIPEPISAELIDRMSELTTDESSPKFAISHVRARSATEALLRMLKYKCDRKAYASAVTMVLCQRLVRRLCETCRQPYQASPEMAKRLGADPRQPLMLYREYQPTPEELVNEKGEPIPPPVCPVCSGLGYIGRMAIFELLEVNDAIRKVMIAKPGLEALDLAARKSGHKTIQQEGIKAVIDGQTSLAELQRVLKGK